MQSETPDATSRPWNFFDFAAPDPAMLERFTRRIRWIMGRSNGTRIGQSSRYPGLRYRQLKFNAGRKYHRPSLI